MKTIRDSGREIPRDVSLIVYEETSVTPFQSPPLTAFAYDYPELVRNALDQLLLKINGEKGESQIVVPMRLLLRDSTGPCPAQGNEREHCAPHSTESPATPAGPL